MKRNKIQLFITTILCFLPTLYALTIYNDLPRQLPIHWNLAGEIDNYASKPFVLFGIPTFMALVNVLIFFGLKMDPNRKHHPRQLQTLFAWFIPVLTIVIMTSTLMIARGQEVNIPSVITIVTGVLFILIGNYLPKCKHNYTMGIKIPWTLHSVENWNKTHRFGGFVWTVGGILVILSAFAQINILMLIILFAMILIPIIYSGILHAKGI